MSNAHHITTEGNVVSGVFANISYDPAKRTRLERGQDCPADVVRLHAHPLARRRAENTRAAEVEKIRQTDRASTALSLLIAIGDNLSDKKARAVRASIDRRRAKGTTPELELAASIAILWGRGEL